MQRKCRLWRIKGLGQDRGGWKRDTIEGLPREISSPVMDQLTFVTPGPIARSFLPLDERAQTKPLLWAGRTFESFKANVPDAYLENLPEKPEISQTTSLKLPPYPVRVYSIFRHDFGNRFSLKGGTFPWARNGLEK
ncbi:hypothetical protein KM043_010828 [Ampulex compressa]|nr:hypothetical protein KM043_010828 [Ampulex compressa]